MDFLCFFLLLKHFSSWFFLGKITFFKPTYTWREVSTEHRIAVLHNYCTHDSLCQAFSGGENLSLAPNLSQWDQNFYKVSFEFSHSYIGFHENFLNFHLPFQNLMSLQIAKFWKYKCLVKSQISKDKNTNSKSFSPHYAWSSSTLIEFHHIT